VTPMGAVILTRFGLVRLSSLGIGLGMILRLFASERKRVGGASGGDQELLCNQKHPRIRIWRDGILSRAVAITVSVDDND
jgi:hypothetical protein